MTNEQKLQVADRLIELMEQFATPDDMPIMVGTLKVRQGVKGFEKAEVGHPVFEYKDRYILYVNSDRELTEKVYDPKRQQFNTHVGYFKVAITYYKESLAPIIEFTNNPTT